MYENMTISICRRLKGEKALLTETRRSQLSRSPQTTVMEIIECWPGSEILLSKYGSTSDILPLTVVESVSITAWSCYKI
jgi:hypothetical protein